MDLSFTAKYFDGTLSWQDIWQDRAGHRAVSYLLLNLLNVIFFNLNTQIESAIIGLWICGYLMLIYKNYNHSLNNKINHSTELWFVALILIAFSLNQANLMVWSLGIAGFLKNLVFILLMSHFDSLLITSKELSLFNKILLSISIFITIVIFGAGYSPALIGSMLLLLMSIYFIHPQKNKNYSFSFYSYNCFNCFVYLYMHCFIQ